MPTGLVEVLEHSGNDWALEVDQAVFGSTQQCSMGLTNTDTELEEYTFNVVDFFAQSTDIVISFDEAHTNSTVDPGKVLLWLLKKTKELLCPSCQ